MTMPLRIPSLLFATVLPVLALGQWEWLSAIQSSSPEIEYGHTVRYTPNGGTVTTGQFRNALQFGALSEPGGGPNQDVGYVVQHDEDGVPQWSHSFTSTNATQGAVSVYGLDVDASGNVYVAGSARDTVFMDGVYLAHHSSGQNSWSTWFIVKFDASGTVVWATDFEPAFAGGEPWALALDPDGDVWVCGLVETQQSRVIKLAGIDGALLFQTPVIFGQLHDLGVDDSGNVYLRGESGNSFTLDGITCSFNNVMGGSTYTWTGKLNSDGVAQWFHVPEQGHSGYFTRTSFHAAAASDGSTYCFAREDMRINGDTISEGIYDQGIFKLDASGTPIWWKRLNIGDLVKLRDLDVAPDGSCWAVGTMSGAVDLIDTTVNHSGVFAFHYAPNGDVLQRVFGPMVNDLFGADAQDDRIVVCGDFSGNISFGAHAVSPNSRNVFIAQYGIPADIGIEETGSATGILLVPVPVEDQVRVSGITGSAYWTVHDAGGRVALGGRTREISSEVLDLSFLAPGPYVLRLQGADAVRSVRFVKR